MYGYATPRRQINWLALPMLIPVALIALVVIFQMTRGLPSVAATPTIADASLIGAPTQPTLPAGGAALIAVGGLGTLGVTGGDQPRPIASMTKMMTAWLIMKSHPLKPGEAGGTITITADDASRLKQMLADGQSLVLVSSGQKFTELQLLQGMLIPSANNFAEYLANWDSGSLPAFVTKMNVEAKALGMNQTTFDDVSGISPKSVSTPADLLILEQKLMGDPVLKQIVGTKTVSIPGVGTLPSVNDILGDDGIIGIKTGFTDEAGGNLAFAADRTISGQQVEVFGTIMAQDDHAAAFSATKRAIESLDNKLQLTQVLPQGQPVATVKAPWGGQVDAVTAAPATMLTWPGMTMKATVQVNPLKTPAKAGTQVGTLVVSLGEQTQQVPLVLAKDVGGAGITWKLFRF